jgi:hypothetical protein
MASSISVIGWQRKHQPARNENISRVSENNRRPMAASASMAAASANSNVEENESVSSRRNHRWRKLEKRKKSMAAKRRNWRQCQRSANVAA